MKKMISKKSVWQSLLSAIAVVVFAYLAIASSGVSQQKFLLPDGRWELAKQYSNGTTEAIRGNVDGDGLFDGPVTITYENDNYILTHTEEVNMKGGKRHGLSTASYPDGHKVYQCYQHGEPVEKELCEETEKSSATLTNDKSAYTIFSYKVPWFVFKLDACAYDSDYVKAYLDTLESVLYASEFNEDEFDDYYDDVIDNLEETAYDSIIQLNNELSLYNGIDLILSHEFRLATLYSFGKSDSNTFKVVQSIYPNYLLALNAGDVTDTDFEGFCHEYDSIMSSYDPVALDDAYFLDSMDQRMLRTLNLISSSEDSTDIVAKSLKSAVLSYKAETLRSLQREYFSKSRSLKLNKTPKEVSDIVIYTIVEKFIHGDLVKSAVKEAYTIIKGIVRLPTVVTNFSGITSPSSVTLNGIVIEDGGGEVTVRGMVWGRIYNPTLDNQNVSVGSGTGVFSASLTELSEGETYYARAFATNSSGTAYGNCISFVAGSTSGRDVNELTTEDFKVYPNPARDHVTLSIQAEDSKEMLFTMFDMNGKVVLQKEIASMAPGENLISVDLSEIDNGFYTCRIVGDGNMHAVQKLLISR